MNLRKEKKQFIETLQKNMQTIYSPEVIKDIISYSKDEKYEVIKVLRRHPDWNESEACIIRETTIERPFNPTAISKFSQTWLQPLERAFGPKDKEGIGRVRKVLFELSKSETPFFTEKDRTTVDYINKLNENYKIHYTGKVSKVIKKILKEEDLDALPAINKAYTNLADELSPKTVKVKEVLSVNSVDFLTMSNGKDYKWSSCHNIYDGCHQAGTISYMIDNDSFVYFQVPAETDMEDIHTCSKMLRQIWFYKDECLASSRLYPQDNDSPASKRLYETIRGNVLDIFAKCLNVEDKESPWLTSHEAAHRQIEADEDWIAYPDWDLQNPGAEHCTVSKLRTRTKMLPYFQGGEAPLCIKCGDPFNESQQLICGACWDDYGC